jgi:Galactose oxidase, central domain
MAYDAATGTVMLFGGASANGALLGDTCSWVGSTWTKLSPVSSPRARSLASVVYDATNRAIVLFGGYGGDSSF